MIRQTHQGEDAHNRGLFEYAPIAIWQADAVGLQAWFNELRSAGVTRLRTLLESDAQRVRYGLSLVRVYRVNPESVALLEARDERSLLEHAPQILASVPTPVLIDALEARWDDRRVFRTPMRVTTLQGKQLHGVAGISVPEESGRADLSRLILTLTDITDRKRAEETLRDKEERVRLVLEASKAGWWHWDLIHDQITADAQTKALFGLAPDAEASFKVFLERLDPEQIPQVLEELPQAMTSTGEFDSEFHLLWPDGSSHWVLARGQAFRNESGEPQRMMGLVMDVTARKRMEETLRESAEFNQTLLDTLPVGIVLADPRGVITHISPKARQAFGVPPGEGMGTTPLDWIAPEHHDVVRERMRRVLVDRLPQPPIEYRMFRSDRTPVWAELTSAPFLDTRGHVKGVITVCRDVTERKQAEERLRRTVERLELLSEASAQLLASEKPQQIVEPLCWKVAGHLGCDVFVNYLVEEDRLHLNACGGVASETARQIEWLDYGAAACGWVAREGCRFVAEDILRTPDPRTALLRSLGLQAYAGHPLVNQRKVIGTLGFASRTRARFEEEDLTLMKLIADQVAIALQRIRLVETLEQRAAEALAANSAKGRFLANVSHELRTPMNAIIGMTDLALGEELNAVVRDYLVTVKDSADILLLLLNEILDFSRIEARKITIESIPFSLRTTLDETLRAMAVRAFEKGLELICDLPAKVPDRLTGDPLRLRQVLTNLLGNATKFTEQGEVVLSVKLQSERAEEVLLQFAVHDTGIGISPEDQEKIFAPFSQADASTTRRFGGTGLGLSIASSIVEMMGGRLQVESEAGMGSVFSFTLSFGRPPQPPALSDTERLVVEQLRTLPVLVTDDNATVRRIVGKILADWGMRPELVEDGPALLARLREAAAGNRPIPLVILDAAMPGIEGGSVAEAIRRDRSLKPVLILMFASANRPAVGAGPEELAAVVHLQKPVSPAALLRAISEAMGVAPGADRSGARGVVREDLARPAQRRLRILVAEDTPANQKLVVRILNKRGHAVELAHNGREAVELARNQDFDAVLMDVQMPIMDGLEATAAIRATPEKGKSRVPIVAMTAHAMKGDAERFLEAGMDAYLAKPIDAEDLVKMVERLARPHGTVGH